MFCPDCGSEVAEGRRFCGKCGARLNHDVPKECAGCGAKILEGRAFCGECGLRLDGGSPEDSATALAKSTPPQARQASPGTKLIYALVALLVVLGGVAWWWFHRPAPPYKVQDPGIYPYWDQGADGKTSKTGFIDVNGNVLIQAQWDAASEQFIQDQIAFFNEGLCVVKKDGKWGYIDKSGNLAIPAQFDQAWAFINGIAAVELGNQWGFIDKTGRYVINPQFDGVGDFHDGLAAAQKDGKWGFIDRSGVFLIRAIYDGTDSDGFEDGLVWVVVNGNLEYINSSGSVVIRPQFQRIYSFSHGLAAVELGNKWGYINTSGKLVINPQFDQASIFTKGRAVVTVAGNQGLIDKSGKYVLNPGQYALNMLDASGLMQASDSDGVGLMDVKGNWLIQPSKAVAGFNMPLGKVIYAQLVGLNVGTMTPVSLSGKVLAGAYKGASLQTLAQDLTNEASAIQSIHLLTGAESSYNNTYPAKGFADSLSNLGPPAEGSPPDQNHGGYVDATLATGTKDGYQFTVTIPAGTASGGTNFNYLLTAKPQSGHAGRTFCADSTGVVRYAVQGAECTTTSPTL